MSTATTAQRTGNRVLDRLPPEEYALLLPSLEPVALPRGYEIYRQNGPMPHVYFPQRGLCSAVVAMRDGRKAEAGNIGSEGMVGIAVYLGLNISPIRSVSQVPGEALRAPADAFLRAARPGGTLDRLLKRYAAFSLRHAAQSSACNALHAVERRMARWLLMAHDRAGEDSFSLTHEYLSEMLGVRRQTVTVLAGTLQQAGLIVYHRGTMQILDRKGLEAASCECYRVTRAMYDHIMR